MKREPSRVVMFKIAGRIWETKGDTAEWRTTALFFVTLIFFFFFISYRVSTEHYLRQLGVVNLVQKAVESCQQYKKQRACESGVRCRTVPPDKARLAETEEE